jgi:hypothetical protein
MQAELQAVLDLQPHWVASGPSDAMQTRGRLVRSDIAGFVRQHVDDIALRLDCALSAVHIVGKDATGSYARVPWVRFANLAFSETPMQGWYGVYLFAEDGSAVYLALIQGTQTSDGIRRRSRPEREIRRESDWARAVLAEAIAKRPRLITSISLGTGDTSRAYDAGTAVAYRYVTREIPDSDALVADLLDIAELLRLLHEAEARGPVPGRQAPEILEAEHTVQELAGRSAHRHAGFRPNAKERKAIERRAMALATKHFTELGARVTDVSARKPYDLEVELDGAILSVEVIGTCGDGDEVLLTRGEVDHHRKAHPSNALVVVSGIHLEGPPGARAATGGRLHVIRPWRVSEQDLSPMAYRYAVPTDRPASGP